VHDPVCRIDKDQEVVVPGWYILQKDIESLLGGRDVPSDQCQTIRAHSRHFDIKPVDVIQDSLLPRYEIGDVVLPL
jgi:hypothetical protein